MSDATIIALVIGCCTILLALGGIVFRAGSKLAELTASLKPIIEAKVPERLAVIETRVEDMEKHFEEFRDQFTPSPAMVPERVRR